MTNILLKLRKKTSDEHLSNSDLLFQQLKQKYGVSVSTIRNSVNGAKLQAICHENWTMFYQ